MKKRAFWFLILTLVLAKFAYAGTAIISGKITDATTGSVVSSADVEIKILSYVTSVGDKEGDFSWISKRIRTDAKGIYSTTIYFPEIIEICFAVEVIKLYPDRFGKGESYIPFINAPPENNKTYNLDIKLFSYPDTALIQGYIRDAETGLAINPAAVVIYSSSSPYPYKYVYTDSSGFYHVLLPAGRGAPIFSLEALSVGSEVKYINQKIDLGGIKSRKIYNYSLFLKRDTEAAYLSGNVLDAATQKPIPFVRICVRETDGYQYCNSNTDFLGRYRRAINTPGACSVHTLGAHTLSENSSPYIKQTKNIDIGNNQVRQLDFEMIPKQ